MKKKIIIFGCQKITIDIIKNFINKPNVDLKCVVTYEYLYDHLYNQESVTDFCKSNNIKLLIIKNINSEFLKKIKGFNPDFIFSIYNRIIFTKELLNLKSCKFINLHPSYLPFLRGPVPTAWAIYKNIDNIGITIHYIDNKIDTGNIIFQKKIKIFPKETGFELHSRMMNLSFKFFIKNFNRIIKSNYFSKKQKGYGTYFGKFNPSNKIDWRQSKIDIYNLIRVYAKPYIQCQSKILNCIIFINSSVIFKSHSFTSQKCGKILKIDDQKHLYVSCSDGVLKIIDYQLYPRPNKKNKKILLKIGNILE